MRERRTRSKLNKHLLRNSWRIPKSTYRKFGRLTQRFIEGYRKKLARLEGGFDSGSFRLKRFRNCISVAQWNCHRVSLVTFMRYVAKPKKTLLRTLKELHLRKTGK